MTHGIMADIVPLGGITFPSAELTIPKTLLPNRLFFKPWPLTRSEALPVIHPSFQFCRSRLGRCAEKMNVIGKNHITSHHPFFRLNPGVDDQLSGIIGGKYFLPLCRTNRHKNNGGPAIHFTWRQVNGSFSLWKRTIRRHESGVDTVELPNQAKRTRRSASLRKKDKLFLLHTSLAGLALSVFDPCFIRV